MVGGAGALEDICRVFTQQKAGTATLQTNFTENFTADSHYITKHRTPASDVLRATRRIRLPRSGRYNALLYSTKVVYDSDSQEFVLITPPGEDPVERFGHYLRRRTRVPFLEEWTFDIWQEARKYKCVRDLVSYAVDAYQCSISEDWLRYTVSSAGRQGLIAAPNARIGEEAAT